MTSHAPILQDALMESVLCPVCDEPLDSEEAHRFQCRCTAHSICAERVRFECPVCHDTLPEPAAAPYANAPRRTHRPQRRDREAMAMLEQKNRALEARVQDLRTLLIKERMKIPCLSKHFNSWRCSTITAEPEPCTCVAKFSEWSCPL